jgi:hypothetical protein
MTVDAGGGAPRGTLRRRTIQSGGRCGAWCGCWQRSGWRSADSGVDSCGRCGSYDTVACVAGRVGAHAGARLIRALGPLRSPPPARCGPGMAGVAMAQARAPDRARRVAVSSAIAWVRSQHRSRSGDVEWRTGSRATWSASLPAGWPKGRAVHSAARALSRMLAARNPGGRRLLGLLRYLGAARPAEAGAELRAALGLWTGDLLTSTRTCPRWRTRPACTRPGSRPPSYCSRPTSPAG